MITVVNERRTVSCIIPTHNRENLLEQAIHSVNSQQTTARLDLVVVDDAASASTEALVARYNASNPAVTACYLPRPAGGGASASRNFGARHSSGQLLAFLDDDDLWHPDFIETLSAMVLGGDVDMSTCGLEVLERDGFRRPLSRMSEGLKPRDVAARNLGFTGSNFVITRDFFDRIGGFDVDLPVSNDKDLLVRFLIAGGQYRASERFLSIHRRHDGPQLTHADERRASGLERYLAKHEKVLTWGGRRFLRKTVHNIRRRSASTWRARVLETGGYLLNLSASDFRSYWKRRDGRFSEYS